MAGLHRTPIQSGTMSNPLAPAHTDEYSHQQILTIIGGLMLGMFLGALDQSIVSTSIRTIADDLNGLSAQAWVTTAYLITSTISTPIYGKLGDLYGRKRLFMSAITIFILGSLLCTLADSMYQLAIFRAFQGLGAGGLFTLVLAIIGDLVPPRERVKYTGYFMATFATSSVIGPVVGGLFAGMDSFLGITGWRWIFFVNVPIGILALIVVSRTLHLSRPDSNADPRIDWWGAAALILACVPLLVVCEQGNDWGWTSAASLTCMGVGAVGVAAFIAVERAMGDHALIPLRIFRIRAASVTIFAGVIVGMSMFGAMMTLPLYMQIVHGVTPTESGLMMLPMVLGMMVAAIGSGRITARTGSIRPFPIVGSAIAAAAMLGLSRIGADTDLWFVMALMAVLGLGLGNCMQPLTVIVQNAVPPKEIGVATSSATFFRQIGGTLGVAVFLSVLFSTVGGNIASQLQTDQGFQAAVAAGDPTVPTDMGSFMAALSDDSSVLNKLSPAVAHPFKAGFAESMAQVFFYAGLVGLLAVVVLLFLPRIELRGQSAGAAARAEASGA